MRAYKAVEIDGEWNPDILLFFPCAAIGIDGSDVANALNFEGARAAGYRFPEDLAE
jgi:hypothetical protein